MSSGKFFSSEEDEKIIRAAKNKQPHKITARELGRDSPESVRIRMAKLGWRIHPRKGPRRENYWTEPMDKPLELEQ